MKKTLFLGFAFLASLPSFSQTLFNYGRFAVSKDEFWRAYNKNKTPVVNKEQSLREYLELYYKFKLKVKVAEQLRLDTMQQLKHDLQNFRSQIEELYLNDEKAVNALVDEAIERSRLDLHVLHYYVGIDSSATGPDTLKASQLMNELSKRLQVKPGTAGIPDGMDQGSPAVKMKDLGFITAFSLPYEIENLVYGTMPGNITKLYRTRSALHLFKVAEKRKSAGKWKVAQVLLTIPPGSTAAEAKDIETRADSLYKALISGTDFAAIAKQFSEDKLTYQNGGEMPEFGTGKYDAEFERQVFALQKDGAISLPILTSYGYHIVKRLEHRDIPEGQPDEAFEFAIKQQVNEDSRINAARSGFLKTVKQRTGYKRNALVSDQELFRYADSVVVNNEVRNYPINNKIIFSFKALPVKAAGWLNFIKDYKLNPDVYKAETNKELLEKYISTSCIDYYRRHLEEYNIDFKHQLQEFKEGNMLFEIMDQKVWKKAAADSVGLRKFYQDHATNYRWAESAALLMFNCSDSIVAENARAALASGKAWRQIAEASDGKILADSGRYEIDQLQLARGSIVEEGLISPAYTNDDHTSSFVKVLKLFPAGEQRAFEEAKGLVTNGYQEYLEENWIQELRQKNPLKVNETVFQSLLR